MESIAEDDDSDNSGSASAFFPLAGEPEWEDLLDPDQAMRFIELRYALADDDELLATLSAPSMHPVVGTKGALIRYISERGLEKLIWPDNDYKSKNSSGMPENTYIGMCSLSSRVERGRGKSGDMRRTFGAWADIDVKDGQTWDDVIRLLHKLDSLGLRPQLFVASGGGGGHFHWLYESPVEPLIAEMDSQRLQLLIEAAPWGWALDDVWDRTRVLRIPGTLRSKDGSVTPVALVREDTTGFLNRELLVRLTDGLHRDARARAEKIKRERRASESTAMARFGVEFIESIGPRDSVSTAWRINELLRLFAERMPWDRILLTAGWERTAVESDGTVVWAHPRPRSSDRSATTNFPRESSPMALHSRSAEVAGLDGLRRAGVPLTKLRVAAELHGIEIDTVLRGFAIEAREAGWWE